MALWVFQDTVLTKIKKEIIELILHLSILPRKNMRGKYEKLFLKLFKNNTYRSYRYKYGAEIARRLIGKIRFEDNVNGIDFKMIDDGVFEYYILFSRNEAYEPAMVQRLKNIYEENGSYTFIDIGAHYGYFTILTGKLLNPGGRIISIEPNPGCYKRLLENISINDLNGKVTTYNVGLSDNASRATMGAWDNRKTIADNDGEIVLVQFDELCRNENITPDVVKIDVFGAEGNILSGMSESLHKVSHLFCELHKDMNGYTAREIVSIIEKADLKVFEFTKHRYDEGGEIVPIGDEFFTDHVDRMIYATRN